MSNTKKDEKKYVCDECGKRTSQVYSTVINNRYSEVCEKCFFPSKKK